MGLWMSHFWWLALNRKFCKWFLAGVLITFLLRFISTAEFSFAFFLSATQLNGWPSYAEGTASITDEKNWEWSQPHTTLGFKPALLQFLEEMKKCISVTYSWSLRYHTQYFHKIHAHKCIAFLHQPFGLEKCYFSNRKKCSQCLTLGNESISVALLTAVNISCSVLYCHFNGSTPKAE